MDEKKFADLIQSAVDELHKRYEQMDAEVKALGEPLAETKESVNTLNTRIDWLQGELQSKAETITEIETKLQRSTVPNAAAVIDPDEETKAAHSAAFYKWVRHGEAALVPEERKALVENEVGQILVTPDLEAEIERTLPKITVIRPLATIRRISKDRLKVRSISEVQVGWGKLETAGEITESTMTPGAATYQYAEDLYGLTKMGEDELADSDFNLQAILADSFSRAIAEAEDEAFIKGAGHPSLQPEGITTNTTLTGATITVANGGQALIEEYMEMVYTCPTQHRRNGVFIVNSATELALRQLRATTDGGALGMFLWQPSVAEGRPNTFLGYPIYTQGDIAALAGAANVIAIFGDVKAGYRIIDREGITLQRLVELYAEAGLVGFKVHKRVGGGVIKAANKPFVLLSDTT